MKIDKPTGLPLNDNGTYVKGVNYLAFWREEIMRRNETWREEKKAAFLEELPRQNYNKSRSARLAGCTIRAIDYWIQADPDFKQAVEELMTERIDDLEEGLFLRAKDRTSRDGATAAIMLLNGYRSEVFKGKGGDPNGGNGSVTVNLVIGPMPAVQLPAQTGREITVDAEVVDGS